MPRIVTVGIAQLGPIPRSQSRPEVVLRLLALMDDAAKSGCDLIVYPEAALTAFFPHWLVEGDQELDSYFESAMPNPAVQPLFDPARRLRIGFHLGYAERTPEGRHFNTAILVSAEGDILLKYRKIHLPGHAEFERQLALSGDPQTQPPLPTGGRDLAREDVARPAHLGCRD